MKMLKQVVALIAALLMMATSALAGGWEIPSNYPMTLPDCYLYLVPGEAVMFMQEKPSIYEQATSKSAAIGKVEENEVVTIESLNENRKWAYVTTADGVSGWISASKLIMANVVAFDGVVDSNAEWKRTGRRIELLAKPEEGARVLGKYYTGTLCDVLGTKLYADGLTYYKRVRIGGQTGYVIARDIRMGLASYAEEVPSIMVHNAENAQGVIYAEPDASSQVLLSVNDGEYVSVLGVCPNNWYYVMTECVAGYMHGSALVTQLPWDSDAVAAETDDAADVVTNATVTLPADEGSMFIVSSKVGNRVNVRSKASSNGTVIAKYYTGTPVTPLGEKNGYMHISIGHVEGYIDMRFLAEVPGDRESELIRCIVVPASGKTTVNMYRWNTSKSDVVRELADGDEVILIGLDGDWAHVVHGTTHGFVRHSELFEQPEF